MTEDRTTAPTSLFDGVRKPGGAWIELGSDRILPASRPFETVRAGDLTEVLPALRRVEEATASGAYAVGYVAYEAGPAFDPAISAHAKSSVPLVWMNLYHEVASCSAREAFDFMDVPGASQPLPSRLSRSVSHEEFREAVQRIREHIHDGDVYQINYTFRETHLLPGDPFERFLRLRTSHPVPYAAWIDFGDLQVISLSPELFLRRCGKTIETRPMKGTAKRGLGWEEDEKARLALGKDPKNRAENVMIVDLMRNDLGRVCRTGSVEVPSLFDVTRYRTVHQMTSTVTGELRDGVGLVDILRATFPPGSVTGAPKVRATKIIAELETTPRDVYCGAVGVVFPGGDFCFNVAIRTLVCRKRDGSNEARLGLGSGTVMDSDPESEWEECETKGRFLLSQPVDFQLIETVRLEAPKGYVWLLDHLHRLRHSAEYFGFAYDSGRVFASLREELESAPPGDYRVRLLLDRQGRITLERSVLEQTWPPGGVRVRISPEPVDERSVWLRHKTTRRDLYDEAGRSLPGSGFDEVVFLNQGGQLAEGSFTSILIRLDGRWFYPPEECGRLPGIWLSRAAVRLDASQRVLTLDDLEEAEAVLIGNSLRMDAPVREAVLPDGHSIQWTPFAAL